MPKYCAIFFRVQRSGPPLWAARSFFVLPMSLMSLSGSVAGWEGRRGGKRLRSLRLMPVFSVPLFLKRRCCSVAWRRGPIARVFALIMVFFAPLSFFQKKAFLCAAEGRFFLFPYFFSAGEARRTFFLFYSISPVFFFSSSSFSYLRRGP